MDLQKATGLKATFDRLAGKNIEVGSFVNIGCGRGDDVGFFLQYWPQMASLMIDMDPRFLDGWKELARKFARLKYTVCGASSEDGVGGFVKSNDVGGALSKIEGNAEGQHTTPLRRVDTLVKEFEFKPPYFLKFDTHGVELDILDGCKETLKNTSLIMMECYNFKLNFVDRKNLTFDEMSLHMKGLGFRCVDLCDPLYRPDDLALWQIHMVFIRDDHPLWKHNGYSPPPK